MFTIFSNYSPRSEGKENRISLKLPVDSVTIRNSGCSRGFPRYSVFVSLPFEAHSARPSYAFLFLPSQWIVTIFIFFISLVNKFLYSFSIYFFPVFKWNSESRIFRFSHYKRAIIFVIKCISSFLSGFISFHKRSRIILTFFCFQQGYFYFCAILIV